MKRITCIIGFLFATYCIQGQTMEQNSSWAAAVGTGIAMSTPSQTPVILRVKGYYHIGDRFSTGAGTGISLYETMLIPLFAHAKFEITQPKKFTPYLECGGGYAFAPDKKTNGGFYLHPSFGVQYAMTNKMKLRLAVGYELQRSERLKEYGNDHITSGFVEKLSHHSISIKVGVSGRFLR